MNAIVSVTRDWGIGLEGQLAVSNRADMRHFVRLTCSGRLPREAADGEVLGTVVMGRKTFQSFPSGALKARRNIVVTRDPSYVAPGSEVAHSLDEALSMVAAANPDTVWLIGGESLYRQLLPHCTRAFVTKNDVLVPADAFFPNLDDDPSWQVESIEPGGVTDEGVPFSFVTYVHAASE